jgi:putative peptide zinc metalloprotease protein
MIAGAAELAEFEGLRDRVEVDTGETSPSFLLLGKHGSQIRVSAAAHRLLSLAAEHGSVEGIAAELSDGRAQALSAAEVESKLGELLHTLRDAERRSARSQLPRGFWLKVQLASGATVQRLCRHLTWMFHPVAATLLAAAIALAALGLHAHGGRSAGDAGAFWPAYGLFFISLLLHELGHAAACLRYGARPSQIGFTVYLVFPALYSDVSSAWRLQRWQRVIVDAGGAYLQFTVGALYVAAYLAGAGEVFRTAFLMILYTNLFSLNPIFKFDGYWLVADALGVTNLAQQPARIARRAMDRLLRRPVQPLPWPGWIVAVLVVYSVASFLVWGYFLVRLTPWLVGELRALPAGAAALAEAARTGDGTGLWRAGQHVVLSMGVAAAAIMTLRGALAGMRAAVHRRR